jgi:3',5'-cyclic AMP phosphodiesterase CpdA
LGDGDWADPDDDFSVYLNNIDLPGNERYYSFDFNQIHFITINTEEFWVGWDDGTFDISDDQVSWIIDDLENHLDDFVIVFFHRPAYSIRRPSRVVAAQEVRRVLEPLLLDYGVDLVFSGHDHYYYRTVRKGITHVVTGGGGAELATNGDLSEWLDGDVYFSEYHYCNATVSNNTGNVIIDINVFIFNETDHTINLGDSFQVTNALPYITTTTTSLETTTTTATTSSETTTPQRTHSFLFPMIFSLLVLLYPRKRNCS